MILSSYFIRRHVGTRFTLSVTATLCKLYLKLFCRVKVYNLDTFLHSIRRRDARTSLLTVSNHVSVIDDPVIWGILPLRTIWLEPFRIRWAYGAKEIMFTTLPGSLYFGAGRVIPVVRGDGVDQHAIDVGIDRLHEGEHVMIYSEGRINSTHEHELSTQPISRRQSDGASRVAEATADARLLLPLRWGVGRLIAECDYELTTSTESSDDDDRLLVLPLYQLGFEQCVTYQRPRMLWPLVRSGGATDDAAKAPRAWWWRFWQWRWRRWPVTVVVGEPIDFEPVRELYERVRTRRTAAQRRRPRTAAPEWRPDKSDADSRALYSALTAVVEQAMLSLEARCLDLHRRRLRGEIMD